jgi:uncharacterized LabA/DUF88 family protein
MTPTNHHDRTAIFVDAGWLLAAAALDVLGTPFRDELECDYQPLLEGVEQLVDTHSSGAPRLRTYWYDGSPGGVATPEQNRIAALSYVKVRLGRLTRSRQQKGVDVLIYHDLMTLARERAITRGYLIAGDEDLREGVAESQKLGVQVVLLGMPVQEGHNQSARLVRECDEYMVLPRDLWAPHCRRRSQDASPPGDDEVAMARRLGSEFARDLASRTAGDEAHALVDQFPTLPHGLDIELIVFAEGELGSLRSRPDLKTELRGTFWLALKEALRAAESAGSPDAP